MTNLIKVKRPEKPRFVLFNFGLSAFVMFTFCTSLFFTNIAEAKNTNNRYYCRFTLVDQNFLVYDEFVLTSCLSNSDQILAVKKLMQKMAIYRRAQYTFLNRYIDVWPVCNQVIEEEGNPNKCDQTISAIVKEIEFTPNNEKGPYREYCHVKDQKRTGVNEFLAGLNIQFGKLKQDQEMLHYECVNPSKFVQLFNINHDNLMSVKINQRKSRE